MPRSCRGGGGGWALLELTDALSFQKSVVSFSTQTLRSFTWCNEFKIGGELAKRGQDSLCTAVPLPSKNRGRGAGRLYTGEGNITKILLVVNREGEA